MKDNKPSPSYFSTPDEHQQVYYAEAFTRYYRAIRCHVVRLTGRYDHADDITQEVFIRFITAKVTPSNVSAYLYRIATCLVLDDVRNSKRKGKYISADQLSGLNFGRDLDLLDKGFRPDDNLLRNERRQAVRSALSTLPGYARALLTLHVCEELNDRQIATRLSIPLGTVKSGVHRGKQMLRTRLERLHS